MNNAEMRRTFLRAFSKTLAVQSLPRLPTWSSPVGTEDPLISDWISDRLAKVMRLQIASEDETLLFSFAIGRTGEHREYADLFLEVKDVLQHIELIARIYCSWFVDDCSPEQMDVILEEVERSIVGWLGAQPIVGCIDWRR